MQKFFTRRDFFVLCGGASLAALPIFLSGSFIANFLSFKSKSIRIRPAKVQLASASFKKYCSRARFETLQEAVKSVRNREPFIVYQTQGSKSEKRIWGSYGRPNAHAVNPSEKGSGVKTS